MKYLSAISAALFALPACALPEYAFAAVPAAFDNAEALSDDEMSQLHGGFVVAGVNVDLGVQMQTTLNGMQVMTSTISWGAGGVSQQSWVSPTLTPVTLSNAQAQGLVASLANANQVYSANNGQTQIWQSVATGLQNGVINSAANQHVIQTVNLSVSLQNYSQFLQPMAIANLGQTLGAAVAAFTAGR